jgi:hypothetical protein
MLLNDKTALKKAYEIIAKSGKSGTITQYFWVHAEDELDDIFCYFVTLEGSNFEYPPGIEFPLFKRNGESTDFVLPTPA